MVARKTNKKPHNPSSKICMTTEKLFQKATTNHVMLPQYQGLPRAFDTATRTLKSPAVSVLHLSKSNSSSSAC
jgi:hypothetical protein